MDAAVRFNHVGFQAENIGDTIAELPKRGITVPEPTSVGSGAHITRGLNDPNGVRLEMLEFAPGSR